MQVISVFEAQRFVVTRSGAIYAIEPATPVNFLSPKCTAILKSVRCAFPRSSRRILSGLMSLERYSKMVCVETEYGSPMHYSLVMEKREAGGKLGDVKANTIFRHGSQSFEVN